MTLESVEVVWVPLRVVKAVSVWVRVTLELVSLEVV
jgi:hypothetical protein